MRTILCCLLFFTFNSYAETRATGTELIRSKFSLTNHRGEKVTEKTYYGKYTLIFFGFSHCPKICPLGLHTMTSAVEGLGKLAEEIVPIFISIDPERDDVKRLAKYVPLYSNRLVGLTGNQMQTAEVTQAFRAFYGKIKSNNPEGYTFDHSSIIYLMDKQGLYLAHYSSQQGEEVITDGLRTILKGN